MNKSTTSIFAFLLTAMLVTGIVPISQSLAQQAEEQVVAQTEVVETPAPVAEPDLAKQVQGPVSAAEAAAIQPEAPVIAQVSSPGEVSDADFWASVMNALGSLKGAGTIAILGILVQLLLKFAYTPLFGKTFKDQSGDVKFWTVATLNLVAVLVGLLAQGMDWKAAATNGLLLAAVASFIQQAWTRVSLKKSKA